jgi:ankyrin repeat protein
VNIKAEDGSTALMFACILTEDRKTFFSDDGDGLVLVRLLIEHGSDINAKMKNSVSALMIASENGFIEAVQILVEHKAEIDAEDDEGRTALIYAESEQHKEVISFLLSHGATPSPSKDDYRSE